RCDVTALPTNVTCNERSRRGWPAAVNETETTAESPPARVVSAAYGFCGRSTSVSSCPSAALAVMCVPATVRVATTAAARAPLRWPRWDALRAVGATSTALRAEALTTPAPGVCTYRSTVPSG